MKVHDGWLINSPIKTTVCGYLNTGEENKVKFYFCYRIKRLMPLPNPGQKSKVWFSNFGNANNTHLTDPPTDGDCVFQIVWYLAKVNEWNVISFNPDHLMHEVSNELKNPSNDEDCNFLPTAEELNSKKVLSWAPLCLWLKGTSSKIFLNQDLKEESWEMRIVLITLAIFMIWR